LGLRNDITGSDLSASKASFREEDFTRREACVMRTQLRCISGTVFSFLSSFPCVSWYSATVTNMNPDYAPAVVLMGAACLAFGLTTILRPSYVRANMDRFTDTWQQGGWHPFKMADWGLRLAGGVVIVGAMLGLYTAYLALHR